MRDQVHETGCTIVCLQEMKMEHMDEWIVVECLGTKLKDQFRHLPSEGANGGVLLAVNRDYYTIKHTHTSQAML